jgi:hypothetical protein
VAENPTVEPWHELETAFGAEQGPALILQPSGQCATPCIRPGCPTMKAFCEQDIHVPRGLHRIRARHTVMGVVLDIEPLPADRGADGT